MMNSHNNHDNINPKHNPDGHSGVKFLDQADNKYAIGSKTYQPLQRALILSNQKRNADKYGCA